AERDRPVELHAGQLAADAHAAGQPPGPDQQPGDERGRDDAGHAALFDRVVRGHAQPLQGAAAPGPGGLGAVGGAVVDPRPGDLVDRSAFAAGGALWHPDGDDPGAHRARLPVRHPDHGHEHDPDQPRARGGRAGPSRHVDLDVSSDLAAPGEERLRRGMGDPVHGLVQRPGDRRVPVRRQVDGAAHAVPEPVVEREARGGGGGGADDDGGRARGGGAGAPAGAGHRAPADGGVASRLRCVYHGWKYSCEGHCVDMPNEPEESNFKSKIRANAYPCVERNDIVWTYMGPRQTPPPLPDIEPNMLPAGEYQIQKVLRECNWFQGLEGDIDTSHLGFLHLGAVKPEQTTPGTFDYYNVADRAPKYEVVDTEFGTSYGAYRPAEADSYYWRI